MAELETGDRGVEIREIAGGYRMATKPEYHDAIRSFVKSLKPPMKLSLQALETLAVVAYKQPVTGPEISEIRGVESGGVLGSLLSRKLITTAGRKQVIGRPILYKTTKEFLLRFGLKDLNELPSIEEFEKMAGDLADVDVEPVAEGGLTTSEAERSLNEEEEDAESGEVGEPVVDPAVAEGAAPEAAMEEQKAGEA
jgi:segregation and condensation protein B